MINRSQSRWLPAIPRPNLKTRAMPQRSEKNLHQERAFTFLEKYRAHMQRRHQAQLGTIQGDPRGARFWFYVPVESLGPGAVGSGIIPNADDYQRYRLQFLAPFDRELSEFINTHGRPLAPQQLARFFYAICGHYDAYAHFHVSGSFFSLLLHKLEPGFTPQQKQFNFQSIDQDFGTWSKSVHAAAGLPKFYTPFSPRDN